MVLTTTDTIEGHQIIDYLGLVTGVGVNSKKPSFSFNTEKFYAALEQSINEVKEDAFQKLQQHAISLKANAIIGISVDIETFPNTTVIMVSVTGTAVKVQ